MRYLSIMLTAITLFVMSACGAPPIPAAAGAPALPPGSLMGTDDIFCDYTIVFPAHFFSDDRYTCGVEEFAYYYSVPGAGIEDGDYNQLMNNHTSRIADWEEVEVHFRDDGPWVTHVWRIVKGVFMSDDMEHMEPDEWGKTYVHTTYFIILDKEITFLNKYTGDWLTYQPCYALDYVTAYQDKDITTPVMDEGDILQYVETFALKDELPYLHPYDWDEYEAAAYAKLQSALDAGATEEARLFAAALDGRELGGDEVWFNTHSFVADGDVRIYENSVEIAGVRATIGVEMDTCVARDVVWELVSD